MNDETNKLFSTRNMIRMGLLSAIAVVLMQIDFSVPFLFPPFLKIDLGDVPGIVGVLVIHPLAGLVIPLVKNLIDVLVFGTTTGGIGELSNFIISVSYLIPLMIIVSRNKSFKATLTGLLLGIVTMTVVGCISNYFIVLPLYSQFMPLEQVIGMGAKINPAIGDMKSFVFLIIAPFNMLKGSIISIASVVIVKAILPVMGILRAREA